MRLDIPELTFNISRKIEDSFFVCLWFSFCCVSGILQTNNQSPKKTSLIRSLLKMSACVCVPVFPLKYGLCLLVPMFKQAQNKVKTTPGLNPTQLFV